MTDTIRPGRLALLPRDPLGPQGPTIGCVYGAWRRLRETGARVAYADVEQTYRLHSRELNGLVGTDRIWLRLVELHVEETRRAPRLDVDGAT